MFADTRAFSGFAVDDVEKAREFYGGTLGLRTSVEHGIMTLHLAGGRDTIVYPKPGHHPADYTILNFAVDDPHYFGYGGYGGQNAFGEEFYIVMAWGDQNCDSVFSYFNRYAAQLDGNGGVYGSALRDTVPLE